MEQEVIDVTKRKALNATASSASSTGMGKLSGSSAC